MSQYMRSWCREERKRTEAVERKVRRKAMVKAILKGLGVALVVVMLVAEVWIFLAITPGPDYGTPTVPQGTEGRP